VYSIFGQLALPIEFFARSGGGGSSSGGGGGDGILAILGYFPMHFVGSALRRLGAKYESFKLPLSIVGWVIAVVYAVAWTFIWSSFGFFIGVAALFGMAAGLYNLFGKLKQSKQVKANLAAAGSEDAAWTEEKLVEHATNVFNRYQNDWSQLNSANMQQYLTPYYHYHASLLVYALQLMGRRNSVQNPVISHIVVVDMQNHTDDSRDTFTAGITAKATDSLIDTSTDEALFNDNSEFTEYWTFQRSGTTWLLSGISQATQDKFALNTQLRDLAGKHGYYYSLDMGWLLIPKRGQLFGYAKFGTSDINNHIIGLYNGQLLVQLYSYVKNPQSNNKPYVIAQVNVPKQYGNIVVRRKKTFQRGLGNLEKVETEWTQFNNKYEVYASAPEQVTSFELLNPTYMEQLEALPFEVNIEVVDNVIYLYTSEIDATLEVYESMLDLTNKAFVELRL